MKKTLQDLWYSHFLDSPMAMSKEEKELLNVIVELQDSICASLCEDKKAEFEKFDEYKNHLAGLIEKEAFISGACFATRFLFDALTE